MADENRLSGFWWLWLPLLFIPAQMTLEFVVPQDTLARMLSEGGPHEFFQFLFIAAAFVIAVAGFIKLDKAAHKWLAVWLGIAALCSFYVAGEEISWGQHFLGWTTPEFWSQVNDQQETNLHNTSSWLDQKPRVLLEVGVIVGGLLIPAVRRLRPSLLPQQLSFIYPPSKLAVTAAVMVAFKVTNALAEMLQFPLFERVSEVIELYMYYFVFLYLYDFKTRMRAL